MAKKQKKQKNKNPQLPQGTSSVESNLFMKGMVKDTFPSISAKEVWEHAVNVINNSIDGDTGVIGNEPANLECAEIPYTIIGAIHIYGDHWAIFSTDNFSSEIGTFDDSQCKYIRLVNDPCLNFNKDHLIIGAAKENFECKYQIYWDDSVNPSRTIILDDPPYLRIKTSGPLIDGVPCVVWTNIQPLTLDCERIRLAPLIDTPCLDLQKAPEGGSLRNGTYQAFIAYTINDQVYGDYIGISNSQSLFDHDDNAGSLILKLSGLDSEFDQFQLVLYANTQQEPHAKVIGTYSTEQTIIKLDYIDQKLKSLPLLYLPLMNSAYEKSKGMYVVNDYLIRTQPTNQFDFNYQPLANQINANWASVEYPADYYYDGGNKPTFLRDERYAFFIRFIYSTGERSSSYHIPGRLANFYNAGGLPLMETDPLGGPNALDPTDQVFKVFNTATPTNPNINVVQPDGGILRARGTMGYWESTELYPQDVVRYGSNCGTPIRHHLMPDENTANNGTTATNNTTTGGIIILAVEFTNIAWPRFNDGSLIPNIVGYEFLVGSREGHKSILGKGILKNMEQYSPTDTGAGDNTTAHYTPNYPYNDLGDDPYLLSPGSGGTPSLGGGNTISTWGTGYNNWMQGSDNGPSGGNMTNQIQGFGDPQDAFSTTVHTFHSPDLMFNRPFLNAYELKSYGVVTGTAVGNFKKSEKHPGEKLLRNATAVLAAFIGIGYAMYEMRGKRNQKIHTGQANNIGQERGTARSGGNIINTFEGELLGGATLIEGFWFGNVDTSQGGGRSGAAPAAGWSYGGYQANMTTKYGLTNQTTAEAAGDIALVGTSGTLAGTANIAAKSLINTSQNTWGGAGTIGAKKVIEYEGSRFNSMPLLMGFFGGAQAFLNFVATGGQEIIDLIYNLSSYKDFAYKYNSHGWYRTMNQLPNNATFRHSVDTSRYLKGSISQLTPNIRINNLNRPMTVGLVLQNPMQSPAQLAAGMGIAMDNSKFIIGNNPGGLLDHTNPSQTTTSNIAAHYCAMKFSIDNQYGQLEDIRQIPIRGCVEHFLPQLAEDGAGNPIIDNLVRFNSELLFGGDCYVNRYTEKAIMPFFWDYLDQNERDGFVYDYRMYPNVPFPTYWMNTEKYRLDELTKAIGNFSWLIAGAQAFNNALPNDYYYLDRDPATYSSSGFFLNSNNGPGGLFNIYEGYMYLHCNGVNDFYVESELNLAQRDWGEDTQKRHYDRNVYTALTDLFHVDVIKKGNYYKYDKSLSIDQQWARDISWGMLQLRSYDPLVAASCYTTWHKRLIYSLQARKEAKKDFWRVFLPLNYKEFKDSVNTIRPISKTGAMVLFPKMSPQIFTGNDELTTDAGTKVTLGDGGLFVDRNWREIVNSDISHEYGSCESSRSVLNTPMGLFFISQEQGKIFQTEGNSLNNITNVGMKWWFNKYLPSQLLASFPEIENCPQMIDNPVVAAGCQTVYDTNNDLVYFSKRDWAVSEQFTGSECIEYIPCDGYYYNETLCNGAAQIITCPDGYTYNTTTQMCERSWTELTFGPPPPLCELDIMIAIDCSGSIPGNDNIDSMQNLVQGIINVFTPSMIANNTQLGIMGWGTRSYASGEFTCPPTPYGPPQPPTATCTQCTTPQQANTLQCPTGLTFLPGILDNTTGWMSAYTCSMFPNFTGVPATHIPYGYCNVTSGTGYTDAVWSGINALFNPTGGTGGVGVRTGVPKKLIILNDGWDNTSTGFGGSNYMPTGCNGGMCPDRSVTRPIYTNFSTTASFVATPATPPMVPMAPDTGVAGNINIAQPDNMIQWIQNNVHYNPQYQDPFNSNFLGQLEIIPGWLKNNNTPTQAELDYAQSVAGYDYNTGDPNPYVAGFFDLANTPGIIADLAEKICPGILPLCPSGCTYNAITEMCDCLDEVDPTYEDVLTYIPFQLENPTYFQDVSWTVSYDPKAKAWISFHDWHPELAFNSINHFMTSKTTTTTTPQCPPGYSFVGGECCITVSGSSLANVFVEYEPAEVTLVDTVRSAFSESLDMAIVLDISGSTASFGRMAAERAFAVGMINGMGAGMANDATTNLPGAINNNVQIALGEWDSGSASVTNLTGNGTSLVSDVANIVSGTGGTSYNAAIGRANTLLASSTAVRKIAIVVTDATMDGCFATQNFGAGIMGIGVFVGGTDITTAPSCSTGNPNLNIWDCTANSNTASWTTTVDGFPPRSDGGNNMPAVCGVNYFGLLPGNAGAVAQAIIDSLVSCDCPPNTVEDIPVIPCSPDPTDPLPQCASCECPPGFTQVPVNQVCSSANPPICKKVYCECPPMPVLDPSLATTWFEPGTQCDDLFLYDTPGYVNPTPLICNWEYEQCVPANYTVGGMWKHNVRNDLFVNYYGHDYPWEVTLIENTGQVVNTLRSIEYQMEAYVYKNFNLPRPQQLIGTDRFHDLDWNFDEAVVYNSEQVSGLLTLDLTPKNNIVLLNQYPIINNPTDIQILYSKEEQKYRFNQFWDITEDRGEFTGVERPIWITTLNGYIKDLNQANLNYLKAAMQHKKFRHYYNMVLLRKNVSGDRKMLLKLNNSKMNISFR